MKDMTQRKRIWEWKKNNIERWQKRAKSQYAEFPIYASFFF